MPLKNKIILSFLAFIVIPFLIVGGFSYRQASEMTKEQVSLTLFRLAKQNGITLERTLNSMNEKTLKFIEEHFINNAKSPIVLSQISDLSEYNTISDIISKFTLDGTHYALFVPDANDKWNYTLDSGKEFGLIYTDSNRLPPFYEEAVQLRGTGIIRVVKFGDSLRPTVCFVRAIVDPQDSKQTLGVLYVTHLETILFNDIWDNQVPSGSRSYLINERNEVLSSDSNEQIGSKMDIPVQMQQITNDYRVVNWHNRQVLFTSIYNQKFSTRLVYEVPVHTMIGEQESYQRVLFVVMLLCFLFVAGYLVYMLRLMLSPLHKLSKLAERYEPGMTFSLLSMVQRNDEIGKMYGSFQRMTERVNQLVGERYLLEMKQQQMELMTLHTQITPHLLYNTLDSIYWTAIDKDEPELARMVKDLSSLLRIGLSRGRELVTVREEIQHIQAYTRLQLQRYQNVFEVHYDLDEGLLDETTPKVILQPIVENAILHGVGKMDGEGEIWIRAVRGAEYFAFIIDDNGFKPADPESLHRLMAFGVGEGYGIRNVDRRIKLHFGDAFGIRYSLREDGGTRAEIRLPIRPLVPLDDNDGSL
ncbi:sensor histidine kinase [Cohnella herbarum]|uniref:Sensor histidine kinase n=1 Tax=Cohnella herbarum TaxID=2728023 RepID=A0A7Z2ZNT1_9BACL|nr:histidine kinase [Cohnella herbarum]QJD86766.1 sensor histidine kinase [Cohnella herbarum]